MSHEHKEKLAGKISLYAKEEHIGNVEIIVCTAVQQKQQQQQTNWRKSAETKARGNKP